jgi:NADPH2:quinone reductase
MASESITGLQLRSCVSSSGELHLGLREVAVPAPGDDEVVVRIEAAPINPSDLALLLGPADLKTMRSDGTPDFPTLIASVPMLRLPAVAARFDQSLPAGNEGAGTVIAAGRNGQELIGRTVAILGGAMYATHRVVPVRDAMVLPEGATAAQGASAFVNPLTALGMVETMRDEGHRALVHTAAASNLGQMLNRLCLAEGIPLVNVVRSAEGEHLLRDMGAAHVCNMVDPDFAARLTDALVETGATIAFDAVGGGDLANHILLGMEAAATRGGGDYNRYGSTVHKQVYVYGMLDLRPTTLTRGFGFAWGVGGWLLTPFLQRIGRDRAAALRERVARELTTTFASHYTAEISLRDALKPEVVAAYARRATGEKYLINPSL